MKVGLIAKTLACVLAVGFPLVAFAGPATDTDSDTVADVIDNCSTQANAGTDGCDTDTDGYGNLCDGDYDQNGVVNGADFGAGFFPDFQSSTDSGIGSDHTCNGVVDGGDFGGGFFPQFQAGAPGPSGLSCAGTPPCM